MMKCSEIFISNCKQVIATKIPLLKQENMVHKNKNTEFYKSQKIIKKSWLNNENRILIKVLSLSLIGVFLLDSIILTNALLFTKDGKDIKQAKNDYRKYHSFYLKNGLEAIIISDPLTKISGASLSVKAGSEYDPDKLLGLAHFCEHMLFLGSKKYPNRDEFFKFISENSGHFNAYTDRELTNYFFDIHYLSFEHALDIFSRFFIDPLFMKENLAKEINAVNSEYEKNLIIDSRKKAQILAYIAEKDNPFHKFTTGNIKTLVKSAEKHGLKLRDELVKFYKKYYTADKMKLIVYTNEDIQIMQKHMINKFSDIKTLNGNKTINKTEIRNKFFNKNEMNKSYDICYGNKLDGNKKDKGVLSKNEIESKKKKYKNTFISPFNQKTLGSLISFDALVHEYDLSIIFIQKSLYSKEYLNINPSLYFGFLVQSKEENSLFDILKKNLLATKLSLRNERDYDKWSDIVLDITLTENGIKSLSLVFNIISYYFDYVQKNLIDEKYFNYLKKTEQLRSQGNILSQNVYEIVSKASAKAHYYPISSLLKERIFDGKFDKKVMDEYAKNLNLENSIIFIPAKLFKKVNTKFNFLLEPQSNYEPWYKTKYSSYKIDFKKLKGSNDNNIKYKPLSAQLEFNKDYSVKQINLGIKGNPNISANNAGKVILSNIKENFTNNFSKPKLYEEESISNILKNFDYKCDKKCFAKLQDLKIKEPYLLNRTSRYELWHQEELTLDFNKMMLNIEIEFDTYKNPNQKVFLNLLENYLKRKLKKLSTKIITLSGQLVIIIDNHGIRLIFECLNNQLIQKSLLKELFQHVFESFKLENKIEFEFVMQETKNRVKNEYNYQPYFLAYDYLKEIVLEDHIRFDQKLRILEKTNFESFQNFLNIFREKVFFKLLFSGSISSERALELSSIFKDYNISIKKNKKNTIPITNDKKKKLDQILKLEPGNYLIRKLYHNEKNKNNCFLRCYFIDKKSYKSEIMIKLFNSIIGNIVFRELRTKRQFGYIAKSRFDIFNDQIFYCIFVQGSSKLPHIIDNATEEVLKIIRSKINKLGDTTFKLIKRENFDMIASARLNLLRLSNRYFNVIASGQTSFYNFFDMENFSKGIRYEDLKRFFEKKFNRITSTAVTVYMYSKTTKPSDRTLNPNNYNNYKEVGTNDFEKN